MERTSLLCLICFILFSFGVCGPTDKRGPKDLSEHDHFQGEEHNLQYDHEAFLGKEGAKEFDHLTPEESKRRLGLVTKSFSPVQLHELMLSSSLSLSVIADKIDANQDGFISEEELINWIRHVGHR